MTKTPLSQQRTSTDTASTSSIVRTRGQATHNSQHKKITIEYGKFIILYEQDKSVNDTNNYRLQISKQEGLPSSTVPNNQQQQKEASSTAIVINTNHDDITLDIALRKDDTNSFKLVVKNDDN